MELKIKFKDIILFTIIITNLFLIYQSITGKNGAYIYILIVGTCFLLLVFQKGRAFCNILKYYPVIYVIMVGVIFTTIMYSFYDFSGRILQIFFVFGTMLIGYGLFYFGGNEYAIKFLNIVNNIVFIGAIFGLVEWVTGNNIFSRYFYVNYLQYTDRIASWYGHPITFANMLMFGITITFLLEKEKLKKMVYIGMYLLCLIGTQSRSAWIAMAIMIIAYFINLKKNKISMKYVYTFLIIVVIAGICFYFEPIRNIFKIVYQRFSLVEDSVSSTQRIGSIYAIVHDFFKNSNFIQLLLGHGERASKDYMLNTVIKIQNFGTTDNSYIQSLYNYGILFFLLIICCLGKIIINIIKFSKESTYIEWMLIPQFIAAFFYELTENHIVSYIFLILLGMWLAKSICNKEEDYNGK